MKKTKSRQFEVAMLLVLVGWAFPAHAQKMYRCGNVYQDRPCAGEQQGKVIGSTRGAPASAAPAADGFCAQRGANAQKIMWARETGRTEEMQLSTASSGEERKLISEVYRKRGTSVEVRAAIEADCAAERQRAEQAAALIEAAAKLQGQDKPAAATPATAASANGDAAAARQQQEEATAREAASRKSRCGALANRLENIRNSQRTGGSAETMDSLRRQRQDTEREWGAAGC